MNSETGRLDTLLDQALREAFPRGNSAPSSANPTPMGAGGDSAEALPPKLGEYTLTHALGEGGMGVVLAAKDPKFGREVAVKVLRSRFAKDPELVRSFLEEARITSRLQHPGVVPVHDVGVDREGRPWFTMQRLRGDTLADRLNARERVTDDRAEFLRIFESVSETLAFAHAANAVHRDLKPANILLGAFGEVMVMDWGLARLGEDDAPARPATKATKPAIVGTPAYMAPELVRGEAAPLDPRPDVFGLGAILFEVITGRPPYVEETRGETILAASHAWLDDAHAHLEASGVDSELQELTRRCLEPVPAARFGDASQVLSSLRRYRTGLAARLKARELEVAEARARAAAEKKARRATLALSAAVLLGLAATFAGFVWRANEAAERRERVARLESDALSGIAAERGLASRSDPSDSGPWTRAQALAKAAAQSLQQIPEGQTASERFRLLAVDLDREHRRAQSLADDLAALADLEGHIGEEVDARAKVLHYESVFARILGEGVAADSLAFGRALGQHPRCEELMAGLDGWLSVSVALRDDERVRILSAAALAVDRDTLRAKVRAAVAENSARALFDLIEPVCAAAGEAGAARLLAAALVRQNERARALQVLRSAQAKDAGHSSIHHDLGVLLRAGSRAEIEEAARMFAMALAADPKSDHLRLDLAEVMLAMGQPKEALAHLGAMTAGESRPGFATVYRARARLAIGDPLGARDDLERVRTTLATHPEFAEALAFGYSEAKDLRTARELLETAVRAGQKKPSVLIELARLRGETGDPAAAIELLESFGSVPSALRAHHAYFLGLQLMRLGRLEEAVAAYREATVENPQFAEAHCNLGTTLLRLGSYEEAVAHVRKGHGLGIQQGSRWPYDSAAWVRAAEDHLGADQLLRHDASVARAASLGVLTRVAQLATVGGDFERAIEAYREIGRRDPAAAGDGPPNGARIAAALSHLSLAQGRDFDGPSRLESLQLFEGELLAWTRLQASDPAEAKSLAGSTLAWLRNGPGEWMRQLAVSEALEEAERLRWQAVRRQFLDLTTR